MLTYFVYAISSQCVIRTLYCDDDFPASPGVSRYAGEEFLLED